MANANRKYALGPSLLKDAANCYTTSEIYTVTGLTESGQTEASMKTAAITAVGVTIGAVHPVLAESYCQTIEVQLDSHVSATVTVRYGPAVEPIIDGDWQYEAWSEQTRFTTFIDVYGDEIVNKFLPPGTAGTEADYFSRNPREKRMVSVIGWKNIIHGVARKHISKAASLLGAVKMMQWPAYYTNHVNEAMTIPAVPAGVWLCRGIRIGSRNGGQSYLVTAEFLMDEVGWEEINIFTRRDGTRPSEIVIPAGMIEAWPAEADRVTADPYGAIRPQTLLDPLSFENVPLYVNLGQFYAP